MPFIQISLPIELSDTIRTAISMSVHESLVAVFKIPADDYFQVIRETRPSDLLYPSSYLDVPHEGGPFVFIHITCREGRTAAMKQELYRAIAEKIAARTEVSANDVFIVVQENTDANWSFGQGRAQMVERAVPLGGAGAAAAVTPDAASDAAAGAGAGASDSAVAGAAGTLGAAGSDSAASATESAAATGLQRRQLMQVETGRRTLTSIQAHEVTLGPGQPAGLHFHPCPVTGCIVKGTALVQVEGEAPQVLTAGMPFYEPAGKRILHFDNYSKEEPLVFMAIYLKEGEEKLIEMIKE